MAILFLQRRIGAQSNAADAGAINFHEDCGGVRLQGQDHFDQSSTSSFHMPYRDLEPVSKQLTIVVGLTVVGFMAFGLALSFYRNVLFEETLGSIQQQNNALRDKIGMGFADLEYYRSTQFKDKYAKENLGKLNPGEKVLIITNQPTGTPGASDTEEATARQQAAYEELLRQMPVIEHWQMYLFRKNEIEKLKKGL